MTDISKASHDSSAPSTVPPSSEPRSASTSLIRAPPGEMGYNVSKFSVWPFRKASHNRNKSRNLSAPTLERSISEPNSPTEPTMAAARSNNREVDRTNYIIMARDLLNDTKLRFEGHKKEWSEFYDRYNQLFANGQPIYGKIVKPNTPKPNAQDVARFLINDIKAVLEELDKEELMGQFKGKIRTMRVTETAPALPSGPPSRPWFDPSTINPAVLEKTERHRSINPEGTWHGHSRSRQFAPIFPTSQNRNRIMTRSDPQTPPSGSQRDLRAGTASPRSRDSQGSDVDEWELARINIPRELGELGAKPWRSIQRVEEIRNDRRYQSHDNIHRIYHPQPEYTPRERFTPESAPSPPPPPIPNSPESMNPNLYLLPEPETLGEPSTLAADNKATGVGIQRPPTFIMYPGTEVSSAPVEKEHRVPPASAPAYISAATVPDTRAPDGPVTGGGAYGGARTRKRSMSLDHQLRDRAIYQSQSKIDSSRDRRRDPRDKEREYTDRERGGGREDGYRSEKERDGYRSEREKDGYRSGRDRDRDRVRDRDRERDWEHRVRDREKREKGKERERDQDKDRDTEGDRDKSRDKDKYRDRDHARERIRDGYRDRDRYRDEDRYRDGDRYGDRYRERDRDRDRDREREKEKEKERNRDRDRDRDRDREKERNKDREKDKHGNARNKYDEPDKDSGDPRALKDKERERDKDNARDRERERERDHRDKPGEREKRKERERVRDRDKEGDRNKRFDSDHSRRERQMVGPLTIQEPDTTPGASGSGLPRKSKPSLTPPSLRGPPPIAYTPRTAHTMLKYDAARDAVLPPNPNSGSRFLEILTSPVPPVNSHLPGM